MFQCCTNAFIDEFDFLKTKKIWFTAALCLVELLLGIPCITNGGIYFLQIMDWYSSTFSLMIISFTELMVISWIYGVERFYKDIELMIGFRPCIWWKCLWSVGTPVVIVFVLGFSILIHSPVTYGTYTYPGWAIGIGWVFALCSMLPLPTFFIMNMCKSEGTLLQRFREKSIPSKEWGPAVDRDREIWIASLKGRDLKTMAHLEVTRPFITPTTDEKPLSIGLSKC